MIVKKKSIKFNYFEISYIGVGFKQTIYRVSPPIKKNLSNFLSRWMKEQEKIYYKEKIIALEIHPVNKIVTEVIDSGDDDKLIFQFVARKKTKTEKN